MKGVVTEQNICVNGSETTRHHFACGIGRGLQARRETEDIYIYLERGWYKYNVVWRCRPLCKRIYYVPVGPSL